jgi:hypothetical protein
MARRTPKIPRTRPYSPPLELDTADWQRIEQAYGQTLEPHLRDEVFGVTKTFLYWATAERALPLRLAQQRGKRLRDSASRLQREIARKSAVAGYTDEFIGVLFLQFFSEGKIEEPRKPNIDSRPSVVTETLSALLRACDAAAKHWKALSQETWIWQDGEAWNRWIVELTDLMERNRLPIAASISQPKLADANTSPFVRFVKELQHSIPKKYRRSYHSDVALNEAIKRARRSKNSNASEYES